MMWGVVIEKMCCTSLQCQHNELLLFLHIKQFTFDKRVTQHKQSRPGKIFVIFLSIFMPCMLVYIHHLHDLNPINIKKAIKFL